MSQPPKAVEFKLRSTNNSAEFSHNVMILSGPPVSISNFTTPVRLVRTNPSQHRYAGTPPSEVGSCTTQPQQPQPSLNPSFTSQSWSQRREKKTKIVFHGGRSNTNSDEDEEDFPVNDDTIEASEKPSISTKNVPWLLEDFDGQHSFESQALASEGKYFVFINQGNEFKVLLVNKWHKFRPKPSWTPLSLEEAEERMQNNKKGQQIDRWLMRKRKESKKKDDDIENGNKKSSEFAFLDSIIEEEENSNSAAYNNYSSDDASNKEEDTEENDNIIAGDQVRRMLKRTGDKDSRTLYSSKNEEGDIVDDDDDDYEIDSDYNTTTGLTSTISIPIRSEEVDPSLIDEKEVIAFINKAGSLTTKELISHFRVKLAMNSCNKEKFREIVRKIAMVVEGNSFSDKLISLRSEYRLSK